MKAGSAEAVIPVAPGTEAGQQRRYTVRSSFRGVLGRPRRNVLLWVAVGWIVVLVFCAFTASVLPLPSYAAPVGSPALAPFEHLAHGEILGTDTFGRSNLSRVIYGARNSMLISVAAACIGIAVGGFVGLMAGFLRGWTDRAATFATDSLLAFPPLVLLMVISAALGPKGSTVLIALSLLGIPVFIRLERSAALSWSQRPFVVAARSYGTSEMRIALRHILPNSMLTLVTFMPTVIAGLIIAEGSLSFLGLGIPSPNASWGIMISEGDTALRSSPSVVIVPAVVVFLTVLAFSIVGEQVRSRFESKAAPL